MKKNIITLIFIVLLVACTQKGNTSKTNSDNDEITAIARVTELENPHMNSDDVLELQNRLLLLGFFDLDDVDGYYGPSTESVINEIQYFLSFDQNGIVDREFWDYLFDNKNT